MGNVLTYNGSVLTTNGYAWEYTDPYNPLDLPPYTIRLKYPDGVTPYIQYGTGVQVSSSPNIWDITYNNSNWTGLLDWDSSVVEVIGANSTGVTNMAMMFFRCSNLTSVVLFDTSSVTDMSGMFGGCQLLTSVPLFDTSSVTNMNSMLDSCRRLTSVPPFNTSSATSMSLMLYGCSMLTSVPLFDTSSVTNMTSMLGASGITSIPLFDTRSVTDMSFMAVDCVYVQSGALALYQQASTQATPPANHNMTFSRCGINTTTGAAELAQIPTSWGGTMT